MKYFIINEHNDIFDELDDAFVYHEVTREEAERKLSMAREQWPENDWRIEFSR